MKKIITIFAIFLTIVSTVLGQWSTSGNTIATGGTNIFGTNTGSQVGDVKFNWKGTTKMILGNDDNLTILRGWGTWLKFQNSSTSSIWRFNCDQSDELDFVAPGEKYGTMHFRKSAQANFGGNMALRHLFNDSEYNARLMIEHTTFGNWLQLKGVGGSWYLGETSSDYLGLSYNLNTPFKFYSNGKMSIGEVSASTTADYRLYVEKGILTEKVKVALKSSAEWSDFVFEPQYQLMKLDDLQKHISAEKHLPEIPSANEIVENGLDLAVMDKKLLQKIEELTLYILELNQKLETQTKEIQKLKTK